MLSKIIFWTFLNVYELFRTIAWPKLFEVGVWECDQMLEINSEHQSVQQVGFWGTQHTTQSKSSYISPVVNYLP